MVVRRFGWRSARPRRVRLIAQTVGVAICLAAAGCATVGGITKDSPPEAKRAAVSERANARWAALIKSDMATAYAFLSPASRAITSFDLYRRQARGSGFREAKIENVVCEGESCKVTLTVVYDHRMMQGIKTLLDETWVIDDGQFWYVWRQ